MKIKNWKWKGLRIRSFNTWIILVSCALYICLLMATNYSIRRYEQLVVTTNDYIRLEETAREIMKASDFLTEQVRLYVQTLEPEYARQYFEEVNSVQRRENALAVMREHSMDPARDASLTLAVSCSNELMVREIYAMKLVAVAAGHADDVLPAEVVATELEAGDRSLSREEKIEKARNMVFDSDYRTVKTRIYENLDYFTRGVVDTTEDRLLNGLNNLFRSIYTQRLLLGLLILLSGVTFLVITLLVVQPLKVFLQCIRERTQLRVMGAYEFRYLADVYNEMYSHRDALAASEAFLREKAEHDALTGILNRYMFQRMCELLRGGRLPLALIIIDVDKFKDVNDTYGHVAGDGVLVRVAALLRDSLRVNDYVFRIGGDEFAALLPEVNADRAEAVCRKLLSVNEQLLHPGENEIPVSLSIGMAFSDDGYDESLYEKADRALYWVKEHGRGDCAIYSEDMPEKRAKHE